MKKILTQLFGIHFHDWKVYEERTTKEQAKLLLALGYPELSRHNLYRECKCGKVQALDIDGWCDFMFKKDERDFKKRLHTVPGFTQLA
jgi:hypothetical protein